MAGSFLEGVAKWFGQPSDCVDIQLPLRAEFYGKDGSIIMPFADKEMTYLAPFPVVSDCHGKFASLYMPSGAHGEFKVTDAAGNLMSCSSFDMP